MEVLFGSQIWSEPYVKNPFIYITDNDVDFKGPAGILLRDHFKKVFFMNYQKYNEIVSNVVPKEVYERE